MKFIQYVLLLVIILTPVYSEATSIRLGFNSWYAFWILPSPVLESQLMYIGETSDIFYPPDIINRTYIKKNFMYGPNICINLPENISIMSMFLFGQFSATKKNQYFGNIVIMDKMGVVERYECDTKIRYSFNKILNLSMGFTYNHTSNHILRIFTSYSDFFMAGKKVITDTTNEYIPLIGIGFSIPIINNMLTFNIDPAFLFCFSDQVTEQYYIGKTESSSIITYIPSNITQSNVNKIGMNASCSIDYFISAVSIDLSLGFRYQMLYKLKKVEEASMSFEHIFGITASVDYCIDLNNFLP
ncbi:MAG: hypothetical protein KBC90_12665 [Spirochaetes bacterium]|nr:hypothetical protein [Spirochaetota bacterium]HOD14478.1 hypothetical protein [Spirochaetota bacterium]